MCWVNPSCPEGIIAIAFQKRKWYLKEVVPNTSPRLKPCNSDELWTETLCISFSHWVFITANKTFSGELFPFSGVHQTPIMSVQTKIMKWFLTKLWGLEKRKKEGALGPSHLYAKQSVVFLVLFLAYKKNRIKNENATWLETPLKII